MHLLLIEDQPKLAANIRSYLETEGMAVTVCHDGKQGFETAMLQEIDLLILDINLPEIDGFTICRELRSNGKNMPILMLTARDSKQNVIHGLNTGADDYLTKPFDLEELVARIRALLRRNGSDRQPLLTIGDISVDSNTHTVKKRNMMVNLSPKEYALLEFLLRNRGIAQDRPTILNHVWGGRDDLLFSQTVDVHVAYLRRKLGKNVIQTVPGKGYLIPID
jgi:DNA-binding response OmpR family regulator